MECKGLILSACLASLFACTSSPDTSSPDISQPANKMVKEEQYFKNFGLANCIAASFQIETLTEDLSRTANGYIQRGNMSTEAYDALRRLSAVWQKKDYPSQYGGQVKSAKCMDFYHSDDLHQLYLQHTPCQSIENWWGKADYNKNCR